jgi:hypothetical protein
MAKPRIWWCIQTTSWPNERAAGVISTPDNLTLLTYRRTVGEVKRGDIVVHYRLSNVVAFSRAREDARYYRKLPLVNGVNYHSGWRFETEYFDLQTPVHRTRFAKHLAKIRKQHFPIDRNGNLRQGYFFYFDEQGLKVVLGEVEESLPPWVSKFRTE